MDNFLKGFFSTIQDTIEFCTQTNRSEDEEVWGGADELYDMCKFVCDYNKRETQITDALLVATKRHILAEPAENVVYKTVDGHDKLVCILDEEVTSGPTEEELVRLDSLVDSFYGVGTSLAGPVIGAATTERFGETLDELSSREVEKKTFDNLVNSIALLLRGKYGLRKDTPLDREMGERAAREMLKEIHASNSLTMIVSVCAAELWSYRTVVDTVVQRQRVGFQ